MCGCVYVCVQSSDGGAECFSGLKVGVYEEIVPMGVNPDILSYQLAGTLHLNTIILWHGAVVSTAASEQEGQREVPFFVEVVCACEFPAGALSPLLL